MQSSLWQKGRRFYCRYRSEFGALVNRGVETRADVYVSFDHVLFLLGYEFIGYWAKSKK